ATCRGHQTINNESRAAWNKKSAAEPVAEMLNKTADNKLTLSASSGKESSKIVSLKTIDFTHHYSLDFNILSNSIARSDLNAYLFAFEPNDWIFKDVRPAFCLLIPKSHNTELSKKGTKTEPKEALTLLELSLGLKIDHLRTIPADQIRNGLNVD